MKENGNRRGGENSRVQIESETGHGREARSPDAYSPALITLTPHFSSLGESLLRFQAFCAFNLPHKHEPTRFGESGELVPISRPPSQLPGALGLAIAAPAPGPAG